MSLSPDCPRFLVSEPLGSGSPVIVEVPHAGIRVDAETLATLAAPMRCVGADADLYVDELYSGAPSVGATLLTANASRYVCDLNRAESDVDALTAAGGTAPANPHGVVWRSTTTGEPALLSSPLPQAEIQRRLDSVHRPYHARLGQLIRDKQARFGFAVLVCAHSMPSRARSRRMGSPDRADVVPGSRGRTTAARAVIDTAESVALSHGLTVSHDDPYEGGYSTAHYGRPQQGVHAIQIEISRRLYMDELTLRRSDAFAPTQEFCLDLIRSIGQLELKFSAP